MAVFRGFAGPFGAGALLSDVFDGKVGRGLGSWRDERRLEVCRHGAINIFVYYGAFEQTLAELNLAAMLRDGGVVLTNDTLPTNGEAAALCEIGFSTTIYSDGKNDGDRIVWLQGRAGPR